MSVGVGLCFAASTLFQACFADNTKTKSDKSTQTPTSFTMINWANLDVVDYLRSGALIVAFCAILLSDQKGKGASRGRRNMWVNAEVVAFFVLGMMCFFFPTSFLEYFTKTSLGHLHQYTIQLIGVMFVADAISMARLQPAIENDAVVHANWLVCRSVTSGGLLMFLVQAHFSLDVFKDQHVSFVLLGVALWFVGCLWQLFTVESLGGAGTMRSINSGINKYIVINMLWIVIETMPCLTNPKAATKIFGIEGDAFAMHLFQLQCVLAFAFYVFPNIGTLFYTRDDDKKQHFFGQIVVVAVSAVVTMLYQWKYSMFNKPTVIFMCAVDLPVYSTLLYSIITYNNGKTH